ncbi:MAG: DinB family protein [Vicinamibacterales bacterium]
MKRMPIVVCGLLLTAAASQAQSTGSSPDVLSGSWIGRAAPDGGPADSGTLTLNLTFDGRTVTGSGGPSGATPNGVVTGGVFDAKTGALKLEVAIQDDGGTTKAILDGMLFDDAYFGRMTLGPGTGRFHFVKAPVAAGASGPAASGSAAVLAKGFEEVSGWVTKSAEMVPADKYSYRPADTVRTFGQQIAHTADGYAYYCGSAKAGQGVEWTDSVEKAGGDKAAIIAKLKAATAACAAVYATAGNAPPLMANIAHSNLHYGNIVTYMRMLGLKPPSS